MLAGSHGKRPVGVPESIPYPNVLITEGGPDCVAAFDLIERCGISKKVSVVCMASVNSKFDQWIWRF